MNSITQIIYDFSPIFVQNIMITLKGYINNQSRYGKEYYRYRSFLKDFDNLDLSQKLDYQKKELVKFIHFAYNNSLFYKKIYKGVDIDSIKSIEDLKKLPIVDKEMLRENIDLVNTNTGEAYVYGNTGGTTGKSLTIKMTIHDLMRRMAMLDHFKSRVGFENLKMKRVTFNGKHIIPPKQKKKCFWRYNYACKQMIFSSFHLTEENLKYYVEKINCFKPDAIDGFFSSMCDLASYIERHNIKLTFQPIAIFPTSETLTQEGRKLLERVFHCKVYDQYASSEGAPFVTECINQVLHMELNTGVFEHYNGTDEVLITSFSTHGTPLIRYRIGDRMIFADNCNCLCGLDSPIVKSIEGRKLDFLYTAEGAKINAGNISNLFKYIPNAIIRAQLVQEKIGEVIIYIEVDKNLYKEEYDKILLREFNHTFGDKTNIQIKHVHKIGRELSGKFRMIKNNVNMEIE